MARGLWNSEGLIIPISGFLQAFILNAPKALYFPNLKCGPPKSGTEQFRHHLAGHFC